LSDEKGRKKNRNGRGVPRAVRAITSSRDGVHHPLERKSPAGRRDLKKSTLEGPRPARKRPKGGRGSHLIGGVVLKGKTRGDGYGTVKDTTTSAAKPCLFLIKSFLIGVRSAEDDEGNQENSMQINSGGGGEGE